jgi:hypothetical protein
MTRSPSAALPMLAQAVMVSAVIAATIRSRAAAYMSGVIELSGASDMGCDVLYYPPRRNYGPTA